MTPIHPYKIDVVNRITGATFARYRSNQVPAKGDQISVLAEYRNKADPFHGWGRWVVDQVVWVVADARSQSAKAIARLTGGLDTEAACEWVELHVWPAEGPHWADTPRFAKVLNPADEDADETPEVTP